MNISMYTLGTLKESQIVFMVISFGWFSTFPNYVYVYYLERISMYTHS